MGGLVNVNLAGGTELDGCIDGGDEELNFGAVGEVSTRLAAGTAELAGAGSDGLVNVILGSAETVLVHPAAGTKGWLKSENFFSISNTRTRAARCFTFIITR